MWAPAKMSAECVEVMVVVMVGNRVRLRRLVYGKCVMSAGSRSLMVTVPAAWFVMT